MFAQGLIAACLFLSLTALPTASGSPQNNDVDVAHPHSKRCDFEDGHGRVPCDMFSVIVGDTSKKGSDVDVKKWFTLTGNGFRYQWKLNCGNGGNDWNTFTSELPWTVDVHPGNTYFQTLFGGSHDNLWIKYANRFLNAPDDTRCGDVFGFGLGRRCLIPVNP